MKLYKREQKVNKNNRIKKKKEGEIVFQHLSVSMHSLRAFNLMRRHNTPYLCQKPLMRAKNIDESVQGLLLCFQTLVI